MLQESHEVSVAIVGAGIAGLTAALRLAQRGYKVTMYEARPMIGGNLGAYLLPNSGAPPHQSIYYDVYTHMFPNWYHNFWKIVETDLGLKREEHFAPMTSTKFLRQGAFPSFEQVTNPGLLTPENMLANLFSGVAPPADLFLWAYSSLELISLPPLPRELLTEASVNGFMQSRPTATNRSAELHDAFLQTVWSVPSYLASAASYKAFVKYCSRSPAEFWVSKGSAYQTVLQPLQTKLQEYGCEIHTSVTVTEVSLELEASPEAGKVRVVSRPSVRPGPPGPPEHYFDYLILAVSPHPLWWLVTGSQLAQPGPSPLPVSPRQLIAERQPDLAQVRYLHGAPVAVLNICFNKKLSSIPKEYVLLRNSPHHLSFLDISQVWGQYYPWMQDRTVLAVAASQCYDMITPNRDEVGYAMIQELHSYIPSSFNPGQCWGDTNSDIDWDKSCFHTNVGEELFVNEVGSEQWRPDAICSNIRNVFIAGDFCNTVVNMATVEGAVMSGLQAAQALWNTERRGDAIPMSEPDAYPDSMVLALKLLLTPYAYAAKWWSVASDVVPPLLRGKLPGDMTVTTMEMLWSPYAFAADALATTWFMYRDMFRSRKNR